MELSKKDRLILVNQYRILQKLSTEGYEIADYETKITALLNGFTLHYEDLFVEFSENELSKEESRYVLDVLELYRGIVFSYIRLCGENAVSKLTDDDVYRYSHLNRIPGRWVSDETLLIPCTY